MDCTDTINTRDVLMNDITNNFNVELYIYMDNCTPEQLLGTLLGRRLPAHIIVDADDKIKFNNDKSYDKLKTPNDNDLKYLYKEQIILSSIKVRIGRSRPQ